MCVIGSGPEGETLAPLAHVWHSLAVRVMSGRNYDYVGGDSYYDDGVLEKTSFV